MSNEFADNAARNAGSQPVFFTDNVNRKYLMRRINRDYTEIDNTYSHTSPTYWTINKEKRSIYDYLTEYSMDFFRLHSIKLLRLRVGHTTISHDYIFKRNFTRFCNYYANIPLTLSHILWHCPLLSDIRNSALQNSDALGSLSYSNVKSIYKLIKFLKNILATLWNINIGTILQ